MIKLSDGIVARALSTDRGRSQISRSIVESEMSNSSAATLASLWIHILEPSEPSVLRFSVFRVILSFSCCLHSLNRKKTPRNTRVLFFFVFNRFYFYII